MGFVRCEFIGSLTSQVPITLIAIWYMAKIDIFIKNIVRFEEIMSQPGFKISGLLA